MSQPMSAEQLAEIRRHIEKPVILSQEVHAETWLLIYQAWRDRAVLLAEVERLRALEINQNETVSS